MAVDIEKLLTELKEDPDCYARLTAADPTDLVDVIVAMAKERGHDIKTEEVLAAMQMTELSDDQLDAVAGGGGLNPGIYGVKDTTPVSPGQGPIQPVSPSNLTLKDPSSHLGPNVDGHGFKGPTGFIKK